MSKFIANNKFVEFLLLNGFQQVNNESNKSYYTNLKTKKQVKIDNSSGVMYFMNSKGYHEKISDTITRNEFNKFNIREH